MIWECSQCNQPVDQPCCKLEIAKLKKGVAPGFCPLQQSHVAGWKKRERSNWLNGGTEVKHGAGQPQQPQGEIRSSHFICDYCIHGQNLAVKCNRCKIDWAKTGGFKGIELSPVR